MRKIRCKESEESLQRGDGINENEEKLPLLNFLSSSIQAFQLVGLALAAVFLNYNHASG